MTKNTRIRKRFRTILRAEGFSLTEVLTASVLMLVILFAIYGIWSGMQRTYGFVDEDMSAQSEARAAMNEMVELIRTAREPDFTVTESLDLVIVRAESNALVCWSDVDRDTSHDLELVRFRVDSDPAVRSLYRDTCQTADISFVSSTQMRMVGAWVSNDDQVGNGLFSYVGANGGPLPMTVGISGDPSHVEDPTAIREVHINLFVDVIIGKSPEHHELSSVVQPRNLRSY